jgi:hypothetical protein
MTGIGQGWPDAQAGDLDAARHAGPPYVHLNRRSWNASGSAYDGRDQIPQRRGHHGLDACAAIAV